MASTITAGVTLRLVATATNLGVSRAELFRAGGLAHEVDPESRISTDAHMAVWAAAMRLSNDSALPIRYAKNTQVDNYGVLGFACKTSANLAEAMQRVSRYVGVVADELRISTERRDEGDVILIERQGGAGLGLRAATESTVAELWGQICEITQRPPTLMEVRLRHRAPASTAAHVDFFGRRPVFDAAEDALVLAAGDLGLPLLKADSALAEFLGSKLDELAPAGSWTQRVATVVEELMPSGALGIEDVARVLATSGRSLQRHLASESTTFRGVVEQTRERRAKALIVRGRESLQEIAFLLGFAEQSSFSRWFKRLTGQTPRQFRGG